MMGVYPWSDIELGWEWVPNGGDLTNIPDGHGGVVNFRAINGKRIIYSWTPSWSYPCVSVEGGYFVLVDVGCTIDYSPSPDLFPVHSDSPTESTP